jgi:hypothetical protein
LRKIVLGGFRVALHVVEETVREAVSLIAEVHGFSPPCDCPTGIFPHVNGGWANPPFRGVLASIRGNERCSDWYFWWLLDARYHPFATFELTDERKAVG